MLGYSTACTNCSPFIAGTPPTTPSSPANQNTFNFDFSTSLSNVFSVTEPLFVPKYSITVIEQPRPRWTALETAEPSTKTSRFNWSEMGLSNSQSTFENFTTSSVSPGFSYDKNHSECPVCSLVPYGALCTNCSQIQTSKATPSTTAWPITNTLGEWEGNVPEEELLQKLDMQLFEQINVPHELDDWGRRVYDDSGNRLLYYQDEDGNTVIGYEAWYPCSVIDDCEDRRDRRANGQVYNAAANYEASCAPHYVCARPVITDIDDEVTINNSGYETWYSCAETIEDEQDDPPKYLTF